MILFTALLLTGLGTRAQSVIGRWKTISDETDKPQSIVAIYPQGDKIFGRVDEILTPGGENDRCTQCEGEDKDKPIKGMVILKNMKKKGDVYQGGTILDAKKGKVYRCKLWLDEEDPTILHVRGYIAFLYRTQSWIRVR